MSTLQTPVDFKEIVALVVEDNRLLRQIVAHVLSDLGIEDARYVATEADGLHAFIERAAHVVIVEFGREYQAAYDLLKKLRQSPHCTHGATGLVALVPEPNQHRVLKAHDAGAEAVVAEPIRPSELAEHVVAIVERHAAYIESRTLRVRESRAGRPSSPGV